MPLRNYGTESASAGWGGGGGAAAVGDAIRILNWGRGHGAVQLSSSGGGGGTGTDGWWWVGSFSENPLPSGCPSRLDGAPTAVMLGALRAIVLGLGVRCVRAVRPCG